jgi:hypothetical protein
MSVPVHCPMPPVLSDRKDSTPQLRQETAALRDFGLAYDGFGSLAGITAPQHCRPFSPPAQYDSLENPDVPWSLQASPPVSFSAVSPPNT